MGQGVLRFTLLSVVAVVTCALATPAQGRPPEFDRELRLSANPIAIAMAPSGRTAYAIYPGRRLIAFDARNGKKVGLLAIGDAATSLATSATTVVVAQGDPVQALVIDLSKGASPIRIRARVPIGSGPGTVAMAPDGGSAWVGHRDGIAVVALPEASIKRTIDLPGQVREILLDGSRAWVLSDNGTISAFDATSGALLARRDLGGSVSDIAIGPTGSPLLATILSAGILQSVDPVTLEPLEQAPAGTEPMALLLPASVGGVIALGRDFPTYLRMNPLARLGRVSGLGAATLVAASRSRAWVAGIGKTAWIVDLSAQPQVLVELQPTKEGLQQYPAVAALQQALAAALTGEVRIAASGTMEYEGQTGTAPMKLEVIRSGTTTYRDDGRTVTYMSSTEVCTRSSTASASAPYACRARETQEPDLVEQFRLVMPWERVGTVPTGYGSLEELNRSSDPITVAMSQVGGPIGGARSGTVTYRWVKGAFSIVEEFGNGPYYAITTRVTKPAGPLPQDLASLPRQA